MLKKNIMVFRKLSLFADMCVITGSFFLGYALRDKIQDIDLLASYLWFLPAMLLIWGSLLSYFGMYASFRTKTIPDILLDILQAGLLGFGIICSVIYIFKIENVSRALILFSFLFTMIFLSAEKLLLLIFFWFIRRHGYNYKSLLVVGTGKRAQNFIDLVKQHVEWGLRIIGVIGEEPENAGEECGSHKVIGTFNDIPDIICQKVVDEVVFIVPRSSLEKIEPQMRLCETVGITVSVATDYFDLKLAKARQTNLNGFSFMTFETVPRDVWALFLKRLFDIVFSGAVFLILWPVFAAVAIAIKTTSKGPAMFKQERVSLNGRKFTLLKFRTMIEGAETKLDELSAKNEMKGPVFKIGNDPRLTPVGNFLRKFSLDEFPQFWNVLAGDMSIVGPRPPLPSEVSQYDPWHRRRLSMRPGLTCLWQVTGRNRITDFDEWAKLDLEYIDNWSSWFDLVIFFKTIPAVLSAKGAK